MTISRLTIDMPQPMFDTTDKAVFSSCEISLKSIQELAKFNISVTLYGM